jgi:hypothetical protein
MTQRDLHIGIGLSAVVLIAAALFFFIQKKDLTNSGYQAVFMSTGQVYFGHIERDSRDEIMLTNVYYFQNNDTIVGKTKPPGDFTLVKLGNEVHEPENYMRINREHVLFIEQLKYGSAVVEAIEENEKKK